MPRTTRRRYLGALSLAGLAALAGCTVTFEDDGRTSTDAATGATGDPPATADADGHAGTGSPERVVRAYVRAATEDPQAVRQYFHPVHPLATGNMPQSEAGEFLSAGESPITDLDVEVLSRDLSAETIRDGPLLQLRAVSERAITDALAGSETALVDTRVLKADGTEARYQVPTVTHDGAWTVIAMDVEPSDDRERSSEPRRVVEEIAFDDDPASGFYEATARVAFTEALRGETVTVESAVHGSRTSLEPAGDVTHATVGVDPDGDEVVVSVTTNGTTRVVHRETYAP